MKQIEKELNNKLKEAMKLCKNAGIIGMNTIIDNYYVKFSFEPLKKKCNKCGQVMK